MWAKKMMIALFLMLFTGFAFSQNAKVLEFEIGRLSPGDVESGMIYTGKYGIVVDERVDISLGISYFNSSGTETRTLEKGSVGDVGYETKTLDYEQTTALLPISANATVRFPLQPPLNLFAGAGFSYQFAFNTFKNYDEKIEEKLNLRGTGWIFRGGVEYNLGSKSSLLMEMFYNLANLKKNENNDEWQPVWKEQDLSGAGFRAGLKLEIF